VHTYSLVVSSTPQAECIPSTQSTPLATIEDHIQSTKEPRPTTSTYVQNRVSSQKFSPIKASFCTREYNLLTPKRVRTPDSTKQVIPKEVKRKRAVKAVVESPLSLQVTRAKRVKSSNQNASSLMFEAAEQCRMNGRSVEEKTLQLVITLIGI